MIHSHRLFLIPLLICMLVAKPCLVLGAGPAAIPDEKAAATQPPTDPNLTASAPVETAESAADSPAEGAASPAAQTNPALACNDRLKEYVVAGSLTSTAVGARTWSLSRLSKASTKSSDTCAKSLLTRAIKEETAYWTHIRDKFKCSGDGLSLRASATCPEHLVSEIKVNLNWLKLFRFADAESTKPKTEAGICDEKCAKSRASAEPISASNQQHLRDAVRAVTMKLPDASHAKLEKPTGAAVANPPLKSQAMPALKAMAAAPDKVGLDGLTDNQRQYYKQFKANLKRALDLDSRLEDHVMKQIYAEEARQQKLTTAGEVGPSQARLKDLRKDLKDIQTAFKKAGPLPGDHLRDETN